MINTIEHKFVDVVPSNLEEGIIYVSLQYKVCVHLCCCGCQQKVVVTLSPQSWLLEYDGESISINPSIGSANLECRSHYYIKNDKIIWLAKMRKSRKKKLFIF